MIVNVAYIVVNLEVRAFVRAIYVLPWKLHISKAIDNATQTPAIRWFPFDKNAFFKHDVAIRPLEPQYLVRVSKRLVPGNHKVFLQLCTHLTLLMSG